MALYEFTEELSVGITGMDNHHRKLFDIMNKLHEAMKGGKSEEVLIGIIKEMSDYTRYHFDEEEALMASVNYVGLPAQKAAHKAFIAKIDEFKDQAEGGMAIFVVTKLASTAADWLKKHIMVMDKQYTEALKSGGN